MSRFIIALCVSVSVLAAQPVPQDPKPRALAEQNLAAKLQQDPDNIQLLLDMGAMKLEDGGQFRDASERAAALDEAESLYQRVVTHDSNNTTALYHLGVLGWMRVFPELRTARTKLGMDPETPGPLRDRATRAVLSGKYARTLSGSVDYLQRVLEIDPQSNDAMAYLNLVFRAKADLEDTAVAAREDTTIADHWVQKALETAQAKGASGTPVNSSFAEVPPPPALGPRPRPNAIRVGSVQAASLLRKVDPIYPELAEKARVQGQVRLNAKITKDGTVADLTVISGHPLLVPAALEAARQWLYRPTRLNGEPVEVLTELTVDFVLPPAN